MAYRSAFVLALLLAPAPLWAQGPYQPVGVSDADALADTMRRLGANPLDLDALLTAGELSVRLEDLSAAGAFFARAEKIDSRNGRAKAGEGAILVRSERPAEAMRYFALAETYGFAPARFASDRGLAYDLLGDQGRAQRDYKLALATRDDPETRRRYALSLGIAGRQAQALDQLAALIRQNDRAAWRTRAFVLAMGGDAAEAGRIAQTMMPPGAAAGLRGFFAELPRLPAVDRAFAVHFGEVRPSATRLADARLAPQQAPLPIEAAPVQVAAVAAPPVDKRAKRDRRKDRTPVQVAAVLPPPVAQAQPQPPAYAAPAYAPPAYTPPAYRPPAYQPQVAAATAAGSPPLSPAELASLAAAGNRRDGRRDRREVASPRAVFTPPALTAAQQANLAAASGRTPTPGREPVQLAAATPVPTSTYRPLPSPGFSGVAGPARPTFPATSSATTPAPAAQLPGASIAQGRALPTSGPAAASVQPGFTTTPTNSTALPGSTQAAGATVAITPRAPSTQVEIARVFPGFTPAAPAGSETTVGTVSPVAMARPLSTPAPATGASSPLPAPGFTTVPSATSQGAVGATPREAVVASATPAGSAPAGVAAISLPASTAPAPGFSAVTSAPVTAGDVVPTAPVTQLAAAAAPSGPELGSSEQGGQSAALPQGSSAAGPPFALAAASTQLPTSASSEATSGSTAPVTPAAVADGPAVSSTPLAPLVEPAAKVAVARTPARPARMSRGQADSILAKIVANLSIPASELGVEGPTRAAPGEGTPAERRAAERKAAAEKAITDKKAGADKSTADKKAVADKAADKRAATDKKALADKKAAAEKKALADEEAAEEKKAARAEPERIWVQVAGGASEGDLARAWRAAQAKAAAPLTGRRGYTTPLRATNRVLTGPFKTEAEARALVNQLAKAGVSAFPFTSEAGQKVVRLVEK